MTRGAWTAEERRVVALCAIGAVAFAIANPFLWRWSLEFPGGESFVPALWLGTALAVVPTCFALAAVVLTARAPVGCVIALVSGVIQVVANLRTFDDSGSLLGTQDYLRWVLWAVLVALALLAADAMAWRLERFTVATGAVAGMLVALVGGLVKITLDVVGPGSLSLDWLPAEYWLTVYVVPSAMLVAVGAMAGGAVHRLDVPQETAGRA